MSFEKSPSLPGGGGAGRGAGAGARELSGGGGAAGPGEQGGGRAWGTGPGGQAGEGGVGGGCQILIVAELQVCLERSQHKARIVNVACLLADNHRNCCCGNVFGYAAVANWFIDSECAARPNFYMWHKEVRFCWFRSR